MGVTSGHVSSAGAGKQSLTWCSVSRWQPESAGGDSTSYSGDEPALAESNVAVEDTRLRGLESLLGMLRSCAPAHVLPFLHVLHSSEGAIFQVVQVQMAYLLKHAPMKTVSLPLHTEKESLS